MSATFLHRQFCRIAKCRLNFCDFFLQEFAQIFHEFANTKHMLNLLLLKSSDLEIKRLMSLGKNDKKILMKGPNQFSACPGCTIAFITLCLFFQITFVLYYILNVVNKFLLF